MKNKINTAKIWLIKLFCLVILLLFGIYSRLNNLNWDANNHLHPDERFLTMVTGQLSWPNSWQSYFSTETSPLNPHNSGHKFFVYGQWPLFFVKAFSQFLGLDTYEGITQVGRLSSALFELGTLLLVILIGAQLAPQKQRFLAGMLSGLSYVLFTLPIQMAHYYIVDPYLVFCLVFCFFLLIQKPSLKIFLAVGVFFGLAISTKISAIYFAPFIGIRLLQLFLEKNISFKKAATLLFVAGIAAIVTIRVAYPMLFSAEGFWPTAINQRVITNWMSLKAFDGKDTPFPPALQWVPTQPVTYLLSQASVWGIGLPLTLLGLIAMAFILHFRKQFKISHPIWLALFWAVLLMTYQSLQFAKTLRYIYPALPFLAAAMGAALAQIQWQKQPKTLLACMTLFVLGLWWCWSFQSIYRHPHSRVTASTWIYENIPQNSAISYEYWDDALPVPVDKKSVSSFSYRIIELPLYDPDSAEKWFLLSSKLATVDYLVLSSNRLWRSLSALPEKYPTTTNYYKLLFNGELGFTKVAQFSSYPCLLPKRLPSNYLEATPPLRPNILQLTQTNDCFAAIADDGAEEAVTVYDHPVVLIFKNTDKFTPEQIRTLLLKSKYQ
jgi:hypothetical protein